MSASTGIVTDKHITVIGAGAVGGYVGGKLTHAGYNVTLVDGWPEHIEAIKQHGIHLSNLPGEYFAPTRALHMHEVQGLIRTPVDIAVICTKSYDTEWATAMVKQYLSPRGYVVSMQNGINEERIAGIVGWGRTVGCILSTIGVNCYQAGHVRRIRGPGDASHPVFRVGEVHGRTTERASELAAILSAVDHAKVTADLWGERWTKLTANANTHGLLASIGRDNRVVYLEHGLAQRLLIKLACESIRVGRTLGYCVGTIYGMEPDLWLRAGAGEAPSLAQVREGMHAWFSRHTEPSPSSSGRDVARGRRSEVAYTNGLVAEKGKEAGVPAPTHEKLTQIVMRIDRGELKQDMKNIEGVE